MGLSTERHAVWFASSAGNLLAIVEKSNAATLEHHQLSPDRCRLRSVGKCPLPGGGGDLPRLLDAAPREARDVIRALVRTDLG
ncbi:MULTISPECIES: hypothetical protein [Parafrankia]|uniref:hypothetical protein n=1 Tax=Parafrankia TaxID=2994362 RepID=UPI000A55F801|nr:MULTISPECIES: hypothetical protein [Parafrankia]MBE3203283.1 hypothetical protein [Parafrankia sp. CH37]